MVISGSLQCCPAAVPSFFRYSAFFFSFSFFFLFYTIPLALSGFLLTMTSIELKKLLAESFSPGLSEHNFVKKTAMDNR